MLAIHRARTICPNLKGNLLLNYPLHGVNNTGTIQIDAISDETIVGSMEKIIQTSKAKKLFRRFLCARSPNG